MFSWTPEYALGIPEMDGEHRQLVDMMKKLELAAERPDRTKIVKEVIAEISGYVETHLRHEEELMRDSHYPQYEQHRKTHKDFARKVTDLQLFSGLDPMELHRILLDWLIEHIMKADRDYVPYVLKWQEERA